jgi:hypothetical protein
VAATPLRSDVSTNRVGRFPNRDGFASVLVSGAPTAPWKPGMSFAPLGASHSRAFPQIVRSWSGPPGGSVQRPGGPPAGPATSSAHAGGAAGGPRDEAARNCATSFVRFLRPPNSVTSVV